MTLVDYLLVVKRRAVTKLIVFYRKMNVTDFLCKHRGKYTLNVKYMTMAENYN